MAITTDPLALVAELTGKLEKCERAGSGLYASLQSERARRRKAERNAREAERAFTSIEQQVGRLLQKPAQAAQPRLRPILPWQARHEAMNAEVQKLAPAPVPITEFGRQADALAEGIA